MTTSSYLGGQSGVQYNGIETDEGGYPKFNLQNVLLVGEFKRGPFHKPFKVTKETMEAQLSYDYANPYYIALEDAFKTGAEYVWVMRVDATVYVWGEWQVNASIAIQKNKVRYTAYKTNGKVTFDSFAELDLVAIITASLSDPNMQQWQAVKDATANLIGAGVGYEWDSVNSRISYVEVKPLKACAPDGSNCTDSPYLYRSDWRCQINYETIYAKSVIELAKLTAARFEKHYLENTGNGFEYAAGEVGESSFTLNSINGSNYCPVFRDNNPQYVQAITPTLYKSFIDIAQKIISNASSSDQGISLLAETYIEQVAKNVSLDNLIPQFEVNKTQR